AQELARRTGAGLVVFGALVGAGPDSVRLTATVFDARAGATVAELEIPGSAERMDRISDSLTIAVITELGRTRPIGGARLSSLGSRSLPAIKAFLKSEQFYRRAQWDSSLVYARRAVATDSGFTLALRRISLSLWWGDDPSVTPDLLLEGAHNRGLAPRDSLLVTADSLWGALNLTGPTPPRSEEHTSELQSRGHLVCRLLLEKKKRRTATPRSSWPSTSTALSRPP